MNITQLQDGLADIKNRVVSESTLTNQSRDALVEFVQKFEQEMLDFTRKTSTALIDAILASFNDRVAALDEINHGPSQLKEAAE